MIASTYQEFEKSFRLKKKTYTKTSNVTKAAFPLFVIRNLVERPREA